MDALTTRVTRRQLLRGTVAAGLGLAASSALGSAPALAAPVKQGTVELTFWKSAHSLFEKERWTPIIADFEAKNPNIKIKHTITDWETWDQTYTAGFAGGSPPDVSYMPDQYYIKFAETKQLADLGPWVNSSDYAEEKKAWFENAWNLGNYKGVQVGIPSIATAFFIYVNMDMWNSLGLKDFPTTYDGLVEAAKAGTKEGETWGYSMVSSAVDSAYFAGFQYFHDNGANFLNEDHTANGFNNEGGLRALTFLTDLFCTHKVTPPAGSYNRTQRLDLFKGGKVLMIMEETSQHGDFKQQGLPFKYDGYLQPPGSVKQTSFGNYGFFMIAEASQKKEEAWKFIRYITSAGVMGPYAELHGFLLMRGDYEMYKNDPFAKKVQDNFGPKVEGFQLHPKLREFVTAMWNEFEAALACQTDPKSALQAAADKVDSIVQSA